VNLGPTDKHTPQTQQMYRHSEGFCTGVESPACNSLSVSHGPTGASTARLRGLLTVRGGGCSVLRHRGALLRRCHGTHALRRSVPGANGDKPLFNPLVEVVLGRHQRYPNRSGAIGLPGTWCQQRCPPGLRHRTSDVPLSAFSPEGWLRERSQNIGTNRVLFSTPRKRQSYWIRCGPSTNTGAPIASACPWTRVGFDSPWRSPRAQTEVCA